MNLAEVAYSLYVDYVGLKLHFNGEMEWRPGVLAERLDPMALARRADWRMFVRVCEDRGDDVIENRTAIVTLFVSSPNAWIGDMLGEDFKKAHLARLQRLRRLDETFITDISRIQDAASALGIEFLDYVVTGDPPHIIKSFNKGANGVCQESMALVHHATDFASTVTSHPLWEKQRKQIARYAPLLAPYIDLTETKDLICNSVCAPSTHNR